MAETCDTTTARDSMWVFCPSLAASNLFAGLFGVTVFAHVVQGIMYRKKYTWVIVFSGLLQCLAYISRSLSIQNPASFPLYAIWFVLILVAPLWTNAFAYMVFGRMVYNFTSDARVFRLKAWFFGIIFVTLDVICMLVQIYGAVQATGDHVPDQQILDGLHIYMGGIGLQQFFILIFTVFALRLFMMVLKNRGMEKRQKALHLHIAVFVAITLITVRIIYRLCEYGKGLESTMSLHEEYQYCLDSVPMLIASVTFNIIHPGRIMPGKESDMPGILQRRKMRKAEKSYVSSDTELHPTPFKRI